MKIACTYLEHNKKIFFDKQKMIHSKPQNPPYLLKLSLVNS